MAKTVYTCPMHPEIISDKPGRCPKCGMKLVEKGKEAVVHQQPDTTQSYKPLYIIIALITVVSIAAMFRNGGSVDLASFLTNFMAGFFLVFSGFKLLDLSGFAEGYSTYDLLAKRVFSYGYIYPFLELLLGLAYVINFQPQLTNLVTFVLMTFSGIGVAIKLLKHEKFQCACLGTFLKVPLTKVTLVEDFGMSVMALFMLLR